MIVDDAGFPSASAIWLRDSMRGCECSDWRA